MNRLKDYFEEPEDVPTLDNYYVVRCGWTSYVVTRETAAEVVARLGRFRRRRWLHFTDHVGAAVHVRTDTVVAVFESTTGQRQAEREFERARKLEEKADRRPWEDDD
ncbi:MAG TPA: hypothetical protein VFQ38_19935 [Longimicrobiales bacterium]|nr:hypothetical protein [Longimicrobiales bacterium]